MSDIKFSNLIFEEGKDVIAQATNPTFQHYQTKINTPGTNLSKLTEYANLDPKEEFDYSQRLQINENVLKKRLDHYLGKINAPGTNLIALELAVEADPNLTEPEKNNLDRMIVDKRKDPSKTLDYKTYSTYAPRTFTTNPNERLPYSDYGETYQRTDMQKDSPIVGAGTGTTLIIDPESGTPITPEEFAKLQLESHYAGGVEKDPSIKTRGMKPSTESIGMEQEQTLASLETQYKEIQKKINLLDKVYAEIVRNPTNLNLGNILNAHSSSKFVKLAEKDEKEADQKNIDYVADYYQDFLYDETADKPQYGPAIKNPGKWRKIPTTKIPD